MDMEFEKKDVLTEEEKEQRRKERNKRRKYRLLILLLLLLGTGVMLGTSTYAWFTANKNVSVSRLTVNIEAKNGIQISADGTNWKSIVSTADLSGAKAGVYNTAVNQLPGVLEPVSTDGTPTAAGKLNMYYGTVVASESDDNKGQYILTATGPETEADGTTGKFIAFDLFFKVDADTPVYLVAGSGATTSDATDTGIKNAARIALVNLGHTTSGAELSAIQGLNAGASSEVTLWEPNYDVHTASGVSAAHDYYGITTAKTGGSLIPYSGVIDEIDESKDILLKDCTQTKNSDYFKDVTPTISTVEGFTTYQPLFTFTKGITKVRVYMWVEGQDVDCENNASGGNINFDLKISTQSAA